MEPHPYVHAPENHKSTNENTACGTNSHQADSNELPPDGIP